MKQQQQQQKQQQQNMPPKNGERPRPPENGEGADHILALVRAVLVDYIIDNGPRRDWLVGFVALRPKSTATLYGYCGTVSSPSHTFSWAGLNKRLTSNLCTYFRL